MNTQIPPNEVFTESELFYMSSLNEYKFRGYLAIKAQSFGCHGVSKVCAIMNTSKNTIYRGLYEIKVKYSPPNNRIRKPGGGRKTELSKHPEYIEAFNEIVKPYIAGLPQDENTIWISKSVTAITREMKEKGYNVSAYIVRQIMKTLNFHKRSFIKDLPMKEVENRDEQFMNIANIKEEAIKAGIPIISIDTKKKELIGNFKRNGQVYCKGNPKSFDHDFGTFSEGMLIPHGIYDILTNTGYMTFGVSHDTSEFVCKNIERVWEQHLHHQYPDANTLMILCDGGGSNSSSHHIVKQNLMNLSNRLGIKIFVMHYPPYCSKWNPIEHRLFSQISRSWSGAPLLTIDECVERAEATTTSKGLKVYVNVDLNEYSINRQLDENYKEKLAKHVVPQEKLPKWNYLIKPA